MWWIFLLFLVKIEDSYEGGCMHFTGLLHTNDNNKDNESSTFLQFFKLSISWIIIS